MLWKLIPTGQFKKDLKKYRNKPEEMERAIEEMSKDLGPNQALAFINIVESYTIPIFPIITTEECTINATVIEFTDSAATPVRGISSE